MLFSSGYKNQYQYYLYYNDHKKIPAEIRTAARLEDCAYKGKTHTNKHINTWGR